MRKLLLLAAIAAVSILEPAIAQTPPLEERITTRAIENALRLDYDGATFSGAAFGALLEEGKAAQFFLLGEEHGIAENPKLAAQLFAALRSAGYRKFAIEISNPMAAAVDRAAKDGEQALKAFLKVPGQGVAFFTMKEEAELLAAARASAPREARLFWGLDYEVGGDRHLVSLLERKRRPKSADAAFAALKAAQAESWANYAQTGSPQYIFSFSGDPELIRTLRNAWPRADAETLEILEALEETFEINRLWIVRQGFASNERRSEFMRQTFLRLWRAEKAAGRAPKTFFKFGASHLVRGRNMSEVYDLGALLPEIAALEGGRAFSLLVLPGAGSSTAVFDPTAFVYRTAPPKDGYMQGLEPIYAAAAPGAFTLIDLRPLRALLPRWREGVDPELMRVVHGFDAVLILSGSTPSSNL